MSDKDPRPFIKLDVGIRTHPKMLELSDSAQLMFIHALCYCGQYLTDGLATRLAVASLGYSEEVRDELVHAGLLVERGDGNYVIRDYLKHQTSSDEVAARRAANKENGRKGGLAKAAASKSLSKSVAARSSQSLSDSVSETLSDSVSETLSQKEVEVEVELKTPSRRRATRGRNKLFDAVMTACGIEDPPTKSMGSQIGSVTAELTEVGATPAQVAAKAQAYRRTWPNTKLTPTALAKHWSQLPATTTEDARQRAQTRFWEN